MRFFGDTFGDGGVLLTDAEATRAAIQAQFEALAGCDTDDLVVIAFSGHGSETHELITYDTDRHDLRTDSYSAGDAHRVVLPNSRASFGVYPRLLLLWWHGS